MNPHGLRSIGLLQGLDEQQMSVLGATPVMLLLAVIVLWGQTVVPSNQFWSIIEKPGRKLFLSHLGKGEYYLKN